MTTQAIIRDEDLGGALKKGAEKLKVKPDEINYKVIQEGKRGIFRHSPFIVQVSLKKEKREALNQNQALKEAEKIMLDLKKQKEEEKTDQIEIDETFDEIIDEYDSLPDEIRSEIQSFSKSIGLMSSKDLSSLRSEDGSFEFEISNDGMEAYLSVEPPIGLGEPVEKEDILDALEEDGILFGIMENAIEEAIEEVKKTKKFEKRKLIAKGEKAKKGREGKIKFLISMDELLKPKIDEHGRIDFKNKAMPGRVRKGDLIARWVLPVEGIEGHLVDGSAIAPPVNEKRPPEAGPGVKKDLERQEYIAAISGGVIFQDNILSITNQFKIPQHVDLSTGNINFEGEVVIPGDILEGFSVHAGARISVGGGIDASEVISGGDLLISKGIKGKGKGRVEAAGDLHARYIEQGNVYVQGDIFVSDGIIQSDISVGGKLHLDGRRGVITGGIARAGKEIHAFQIGSPGSNETVLVAGMNVLQFRALQKIGQKIFSLEQELVKVNAMIQKLQLIIVPSRITKEQSQLLVSLQKKKIVFQYKIHEHIEEKNEIQSEGLQNDPRSVFIDVKGVIYPGTKIQIGKAFKTITTQLSYVTFYSSVKGDKIEMEAHREDKL